MKNDSSDAEHRNGRGYEACCGQAAGYGCFPDGNLVRWQDKIAHIHLRNVTGRWEKFEETMLHAGEISMPNVIKTLIEIGYNGDVEPEHVPSFPGDDRGGALVHAVGYVQGLLETLQPQTM